MWKVPKMALLRKNLDPGWHFPKSHEYLILWKIWIWIWIWNLKFKFEIQNSKFESRRTWMADCFFTVRFSTKPMILAYLPLAPPSPIQIWNSKFKYHISIFKFQIQHFKFNIQKFNWNPLFPGLTAHYSYQAGSLLTLSWIWGWSSNLIWNLNFLILDFEIQNLNFEIQISKFEFEHRNPDFLAYG